VRIDFDADAAHACAVDQCAEGHAVAHARIDRGTLG
jgi:hypothetical protein